MNEINYDDYGDNRDSIDNYRYKFLNYRNVLILVYSFLLYFKPNEPYFVE